MNCKCPHCKTMLTGSGPIQGAVDYQVCCPTCGQMFRPKECNSPTRTATAPAKKTWWQFWKHQSGNGTMPTSVATSTPQRQLPPSNPAMPPVTASKAGSAGRADVNGPSMQVPNFKKWRTIRLATGVKDANEFRTAIKAFGHIDNWADRNLDRPGFQVAEKGVEIDLVNVSVADLGFSDGANLADIYKKALNWGLELCPNEVGPQLRLQYKDQPMDEWLRVAMEAITDLDGSPGVFTVGCNRAYSEKWWLRGGSGRADYGFNADTRFVFVLPRKGTANAHGRE